MHTSGEEQRRQYATAVDLWTRSTLGIQTPATTSQRFPHMMASVKEKKLQDDTVKPEKKASLDVWRFITAGAEYPSKEASKIHVRIGARVDDAYKQHCRETSILLRQALPQSIKSTRVRLFTQSKVGTHILANAPRKVTAVSNGDHSKMFERLPHTGPVSIVEGCCHKFSIALEQVQSDALYLHIDSDATCWSKDWAHPPGQVITGWVRVDMERYRQMVELILESSIVEVGCELYKQTLGVPMGFDDSPYMSQSFFDYLDYKFVMDAFKTQSWRHISVMSWTFRIADDVFCFNCPDFIKVMESWGSITVDGTTYSAWDSITLNDETHYTMIDGEKVGTSAEMCDTSIFWDRKTNRIRFSYYDKLRYMKGFSKQIIRYTDAFQNGPPAALHGTIIGKMQAFAVRSQHFEDFVDACARLFIRMLCNHHTVPNIQDSVGKLQIKIQHGPGPERWGDPQWEWTPTASTLLQNIVEFCAHQKENLCSADKSALARGVESP